MWFRKRIIFFILISLSLQVGLNAGSLAEYPFSDKDRDPFSPLVSKSGKILLQQEMDAGGLHLQGIVYSSGGKSVAIINDEVLKENGVIGSYTVVKIEQKQVLLKKGNEEFVLKLEE
ncbi:MAG: hypothetical protein PHQ96_03020 [Candidatus Omnitrophica bacterium]|nr:hypothetical protein [Candidatus Omnitrophota bacterium]